MHFCVWAPRRRAIEVVLETRLDEQVKEFHGFPLEPEEEGYFSGSVEEAGHGSHYRLRLNGSDRLFPDPASRFQPNGPFGTSMVVDPGHYPWADQKWPGIGSEGQIIYEMHIGTFTREGTWDAATEQLPRLRELGVTVLEVMPVSDFPGRFGWGYDGVDRFAPTRLYGSPDAFRHFVDQAQCRRPGGHSRRRL